MIKHKINNYKHIQCYFCNIRRHCLPSNLPYQELFMFNKLIKQRLFLSKNSILYKTGEQFKYLIAIRSGSIKSYIITDQGDEQILGFYLPGNLLGLETIFSKTYFYFIQSLENIIICKIPYNLLTIIIHTAYYLKLQIINIMSKQIQNEQNMIILLGKKKSYQKLAFFLYLYSQRLLKRGFSKIEIKLSMTRNDIANYLGITIETVSRIFSRFHKNNICTVNGKYLIINSYDILLSLIGKKNLFNKILIS